MIQNSSWIIRSTEQLNVHQITTLIGTFHSISSVLFSLASSALPLAFATTLFTTARTFYQSLNALLKLMHELEFFESTQVPSLITEAVYRLAKAIYTLIPWMQSVELEAEVGEHLAKKKKSIGSISTRNSFSRLLPDLIYQTEMCERVLVDYSKVCSVNLHRLVAKATSRDFKIREEEMEIEQEQPTEERVDEDPTLLMQEYNQNSE